MAIFNGLEIEGYLSRQIKTLRDITDAAIEWAPLPRSVAAGLARTGAASEALAGTYQEGIAAKLNEAAAAANTAKHALIAVSDMVNEANHRMRRAGAPAEYEEI